MIAVAVWQFPPSHADLLADRLRRGWKPTPSPLVGGPRILGYATSVPPEAWSKPGDESWPSLCARTG